MAAMLPGVGVHQRRKPLKHLRPESLSSRLESPLTEWRDPLISASISALDETALRARQRLEQRLGYLYRSSRSTELQENKNGSPNNKTGTKYTRLTSKLLSASQWHLKLKRCKSRKLCSVCLEDFQAKQRVTELSCSHKYHSDCLYPWLTAHPHCPYCRTPVLQS